MTYEEYKEEVKNLELKHHADLRLLTEQYVDSNNPYDIGDIVTDHIGSIKIEKMRIGRDFFNDPPCAIYFGVELKKDGTPTKRGNKREVWQSNLVKK